MELLKKCDKINDNREIYKFVINKIKTTHYNLSEISSFLKFHGLYLSTHSISWISQNIIYKNSIDDYKNRFPTSYDADIGIFGHSALKFILTDFFKSIKIDYFNEIVLFSNRNVRIDGILINHNNLLNKLLLNSDLINTLSISEKIINKIDFITFDFTSNFELRNIEEKIGKYQHARSLFFIVDTAGFNVSGVEFDQIDLSKFKYKENIRFLSIQLFNKFIGINGKYKEEFETLIEFIKEKNLDSLKEYIESKEKEFEQQEKNLNTTIEFRYAIKKFRIFPLIKKEKFLTERQKRRLKKRSLRYMDEFI